MVVRRSLRMEREPAAETRDWIPSALNFWRPW